ncbi:P-loop NTPase family protein [Roseibium marinum]|uniref:Adenylate kinase family enzyme n=1 Tax=Roseibium marinum TaxID=281252 RepID=A0A2S3UMX0_9HYPH|nr:DNA topology modulation protein FlaR [Roseibium marinum]POF29045.1 adenylate kinase family enzyme [Roseibium marinum]
MKRVMIVGAPGSGKSMLAIALGKKTGLPVHHMDKIHYKPGWVARTKAEKDRLTHEVHVQDRWILEGGHSNTYGERLARADTFIWLDMPVGVRLFRVLRRSAKYYGQSRPDLPDGCVEPFNLETFEFLHSIWRTRHSARRKLEAIFSAPPAHLSVHRLETHADVRQYLAGLADGY